LACSIHPSPCHTARSACTAFAVFLILSSQSPQPRTENDILLWGLQTRYDCCHFVCTIHKVFVCISSSLAKLYWHCSLFIETHNHYQSPSHIKQHPWTLYPILKRLLRDLYFHFMQKLHLHHDNQKTQTPSIQIHPRSPFLSLTSKVSPTHHFDT